MKKILGILILLAGIYMAYQGITKISNSGESVELLGVELSAEDSDQKMTGIIYLIIGIVAIIGGAISLKSK